MSHENQEITLSWQEIRRSRGIKVFGLLMISFFLIPVAIDQAFKDQNSFPWYIFVLMFVIFGLSFYLMALVVRYSRSVITETGSSQQQTQFRGAVVQPPSPSYYQEKPKPVRKNSFLRTFRNITIGILLLFTVIGLLNYNEMNFENINDPVEEYGITLGQLILVVLIGIAVGMGLILATISTVFAKLSQPTGPARVITPRNYHTPPTQNQRNLNVQQQERSAFEQNPNYNQTTLSLNTLFTLPFIGKSKVNNMSSTSKRPSPLPFFVLLGVSIWLIIDGSNVVGISSTISWIILAVVLLMGRGLNSFIYVGSNSISFRNVFRQVEFQSLELGSIETIIYTYNGIPGRSQGNLGDHITFRTKSGRKANFYTASYVDDLFGLVEKFASQNNIEFHQTWKKGPED